MCSTEPNTQVATPPLDNSPRYRDGKLMCNAVKRGKQCKAFAMKGKSKCRNHGGMTPKGPRHGAYKHGRVSTYLPAGLKEKYAAALADPELTEFRADIALLQSRLCQLLESGESSPLWESVGDVYGELRIALRGGSQAGIAASLAQLDDLLKRGIADSLRWREIYQVAEQLTKVKEREHKRLVATQQMISAEQFLAVIGVIAEVARKTISNRDDLNTFSYELDKIWDRPALPPARQETIRQPSATSVTDQQPTHVAEAEDGT